MTGTESAGDYLLWWSSERGSGPWSAYRDAAASVTVAGTARGERQRLPWTFANRASALGHMDVDWADGKWSVAPPCLALSPSMGLCAYLAGWRTRGLLDRLERASQRIDVFPHAVSQGADPTAHFVKVGSINVLDEIAEELAIPVIYDPGAQLADLVSVRSSADFALSSQPPFDEPLDRFDTHTLTWVNVPRGDQPGLHRFEMHGRKEFRLLLDDGWRHVDRSVGQLAVLAGRNDVMVWHKPAHDFSQPRVLAVRREVSLPAIAERAAVAASGLVPKLRGKWRIYVNVSRHTADLISRGLGLELQISTERFRTYEEASN